MDSIMQVSPGLMIWTLINFFIFFAILLKFGYKPIAKSLKAREDSINKTIENAEKTSQEAQKLFKESEEKIATASIEMSAIIKRGKEQAEAHYKAIQAEAEKMKLQKIDEAKKEIDRSKESALIELRKEVSSLAIQAAEILLEANLDKGKQNAIIENFLSSKTKIN